MHEKIEKKHTIPPLVVPIVLIIGVFLSLIILFPTSKDDTAFICRATISAVMGRDIDIINVDTNDNDTFHVYYTRADDNSRWDYKCKIENGRILWAVLDGRWRNHTKDEYISYSSTDNEISIVQRFPDNKTISKTFLK